MPFVFAVLALLVQIAISSAFFMAISAFLHSTWWTAIPALSFTEGFLISVLFGCFAAATKLTIPSGDFGQGIFLFFFYLIVNPFLMPFIVDLVNNELITVLPDISYGTAFVFTLICLGFAAAEAFITALTDAAKES